MGEIYGHLWVSQYGNGGGTGWETWCTALEGMTADQIKTGVQRLMVEMPKFPPSLPEFLRMCGADGETQAGLPGRELAFPLVMNIASRPVEFGKGRDLSGLSPALYWIYKHLDLYQWKRMSTREARKVFNAVYDQCIQAAANGETFVEPPVLIDSSEKMAGRAAKGAADNPENLSKRKAKGRAAIAEMRKLLMCG